MLDHVFVTARTERLPILREEQIIRKLEMTVLSSAPFQSP